MCEKHALFRRSRISGEDNSWFIETISTLIRQVDNVTECLANSQKGPNSRHRTLGDLELEQNLFIDSVEGNA